jgi:hypothetical protein
VKQLEGSLREAGAMLVACQLAGLSALEAHYVGVGIATQSGAWGGIQTALDHVARGWRGKQHIGP